jgi:hypothetical protein
MICLDPPEICLLSSWDYRCKPLAWHNVLSWRKGPSLPRLAAVVPMSVSPTLLPGVAYTRDPFPSLSGKRPALLCSVLVPCSSQLAG